MKSMSRRTILSATVGGLIVSKLSPVAASLLGPAKGLIQLDSNENPYGPSSRALQAAKAAAELGAYYSFPIQAELRQVIAAKHGLSIDHVVLSTGSNEALCAATAAWGKNGHILAPELTYSAHLGYARRTGRGVKTVALRDDMAIDLDAMAALVNAKAGLVYVCNPNNPTGLMIDGDTLRRFCKTVGSSTPVLIDEAYNELTPEPDYTSMMDLVRAGENIVITKTFSKIFGLAGMRVGYALGRPDLIKRLGRHIMSWPNAIGVAAAVASHTDQAFIDLSRDKITQGRKIVVDAFARHGVEALPSATNFVYANIGRNASDFAKQMRERGIVIRGSYQPYPNWSRVSMGKIEDLREFSRAFDQLY